MGAFVDPLDQIDVVVHTPDRRVEARLRGRAEITVSFAPGVYGRFDDDYLTRQLSALAKLLWAARTKQVRAVARAAFLDVPAEDPMSRGSALAAFRAARDDLRVEGRSPDDRIVVTSYGLQAWHVHIAPGTTRTLDEAQFTAALAAAAHDLITTLQDEVRVLKLRHLAP